MSDANYWMSRALELESRMQSLPPLTNFQKVQDFHNRFQQVAPKFMSLDVSGRMTDAHLDNLLNLRARLIREEYKEVMHELETDVPNLEKIAKELADLLYVVYGCADMLGIPMDDVFEEVNASNLSKLDEEGNPVFREDGKILKSTLYREADTKRVLDRYRPK